MAIDHLWFDKARWVKQTGAESYDELKTFQTKLIGKHHISMGDEEGDSANADLIIQSNGSMRLTNMDLGESTTHGTID